MISEVVMKVAIVILNSDYSKTSDYSDLHGVTADGDAMKEMLDGYDEVTTIANTSDIGQELMKMKMKYKDIPIEILHFHYSGHGVENGMVEIDPYRYNKKGYGTTFDGVTPTGDCIVECSGRLYAIHDITLELLRLSPTWLTFTLDCCRNRRGRSKEFVKLRNKQAISNSDQAKIAKIHGTSDLHPASDAHTFTQELYKVFKDEGGEIPILQIVSKVNKSWKDGGIKQMCKHDIVEVGDNWVYYLWPSSNTIKAVHENISGTMLTAMKENDEKDEIKTKLEKVEERWKKMEEDAQAYKDTIQKLEKRLSILEQSNI